MMRSVLVGLCATAALVSSMKVADCTFDFPDDQTSYAFCDRLSISSCLSAVPELNRLDFLERCLLDGGCSQADATSITETIAGHCDIAQKGGHWGDLKKRASSKSETPTASTAKTSDQPHTTADSPSPTDSPTETHAHSATSATNSPSSAAASTTPHTTAHLPTLTSTSSTPPSTTSETVSSTPLSSSPSTDSKASSSTGTDLVCLTTSQSSITWCMTTTDGTATGTNCVPTFSPVTTCVAGLICQTQVDGSTTCMVRQNGLTTSGLVITIIFIGIVLAFIISIFTMCIKSRQASRQQARSQAPKPAPEREAAMAPSSQARNIRSAGASAAYNSRRMGSGSAASSEAHLPLIAAQGASGGRDMSAEFRDVRPTVHRVPSGSYQEVVASRTPAGMVPKLHPGLMDMGPTEDDMGYRGGRQVR